jgi:transcriptional antiterminator RfaH
MSDSPWYLIHSKNRQEHVAELNLRQLGVETFCPRVKEVKLPRSQPLAGEVLFPGYLFIRADMATQYRKITYAHGVLRVVKFGAAPAVVDEEIVNSIKERVHKGLIDLPKASPLPQDQNSLQPGQIVRIHKGPLHGLRTIFEQELNGAQRVALLMKTVAFQGHVIIDRNCVGLQ